MRDRQTCIECGKQSPETETNYTLISSQFGWRLTRRRTDKGDFVIEWRCPDCWRNHKKKSDDAGASPASSATITAERPVMRRSSKPPASGTDAPPVSRDASRDARKRPPG